MFTLNQVFGARPENKPVTMQRGDAAIPKIRWSYHKVDLPEALGSNQWTTGNLT